MSIFVSYMQSIFRLFDTDMTIYGFSFSWWDILLYSCIATAIIKLLVAVYNAV